MWLTKSFIPRRGQRGSCVRVPPRTVCQEHVALSWVAALAATAGPAFGRPRRGKAAGEASALAGRRSRHF